MAVFHDQVSFELEVSFARQVEPSRRFDLRNMLDAALGPGHQQESFFQASDHDRVVASAKAIEDLLRKYGEGAMAGDPVIYERMEEIARQQNAAYTKRVVQEPIRKTAEDAWRRQNYLVVRELYGSIEPDLTPSERKRLEYAKSHSQGT